MKKFVSIASLLFVATFANSVLAEPGFWPIDSNKVPLQVRKAAESVYKFYLPLNNQTLIDYNEIEATKADLHAGFKAGKISEDLYLLVIQELNRCASNENQHPFCVISLLNHGNATLFSIGNQQVATAVHNISSFLTRMLQQSEIKELSESQKYRYLMNVRIPAVIEVSAKEYKSVYLKISKMKKSAFEYILQGEADARIATKLSGDGIILTVEGMDMGAGLTVAQNSVAEGETLYALGFPGKTNNRLNLLNVPDSAGSDLRATIGLKKDFIKFFNETVLTVDGHINSDFLSDENKASVSHLIVMDSDLKSGMSGGPLVNSKGQVVGVIHRRINEGGTDLNEILTTHTISLCMKYLTREKR